MPTNGTGSARADLGHTVQGDIPVYTRTIDQQIQSSAGDSSQIVSRKTGDTHDDDNDDKDCEKIYDGGKKL